MINTLFVTTEAVEPTFVAFLLPLFQISLKKKYPQNHPQYLSGLSRAVFPTTFLEIAVYRKMEERNSTLKCEEHK